MAGAPNKISVSFEKKLADDIRRAAEKETGGNVSAWLAEQAAAGLRRLALRELNAADEKKYGKVPKAVRDRVKREWPSD
jgi:hypothetical protein